MLVTHAETSFYLRECFSRQLVVNLSAITLHQAVRYCKFPFPASICSSALWNDNRAPHFLLLTQAHSNKTLFLVT